MIDAAIAACPDVPLAPWIGFPGWRRPIPGARLGQGMADSCYEVTQADLIDIMTYGVQQGVREWLLWSNVLDSDPCSELDVDTEALLSDEEKWAQWATIVNAVNNYAAGME